MVVARQPRFGGQRQRAVHHALQRGLDELRVIERVAGHNPRLWRRVRRRRERSGPGEVGRFCCQVRPEPRPDVASAGGLTVRFPAA